MACHQKVTPGIIADFRSGVMSHTLDCSACHGTAHDEAEHTKLARLPAAETCRACHAAQYGRYAAGKHALA